MVRKITSKEEFFAAMEREKKRRELMDLYGIPDKTKKKIEKTKRTVKRG